MRPTAKRAYGKTVGFIDRGGYRRFMFGGTTVTSVHRYIFETYHGRKIKEGYVINHINWNKDDNRIDNLEEVTSQQNSQWRGRNKNNTTGFKGVRKEGKNYRAVVHVDGQNHNLGFYDTAEEAACAYNNRVKELNQNGHRFLLNDIDSEIIPSRNARGIKGISGVKRINWNKRSKKWIAYVGKQYLGYFCTLEEAKEAQRQAPSNRGILL